MGFESIVEANDECVMITFAVNDSSHMRYLMNHAEADDLGKHLRQAALFGELLPEDKPAIANEQLLDAWKALRKAVVFDEEQHAATVNWALELIDRIAPWILEEEAAGDELVMEGSEPAKGYVNQDVDGSIYSTMKAKRDSTNGS